MKLILLFFDLFRPEEKCRMNREILENSPELDRFCELSELRLRTSCQVFSTMFLTVLVCAYNELAAYASEF